MKKGKIIGFKREFRRNKPIRRVGLDTDICLPWFRNQKNSDNDFFPNISKRGDSLFINRKVFGQLLFQIKSNNLNQAKEEIREFLKRNGIRILKKFDEEEKKAEEIFQILKKQNFPNHPEDSDLKIISLYKACKMDCIFSGNTKHFRKPCEFLDISFEEKIVIENFSEREVMNMLKEFSKHRYD